MAKLAGYFLLTLVLAVVALNTDTTDNFVVNLRESQRVNKEQADAIAQQVQVVAGQEQLLIEQAQVNADQAQIIAEYNNTTRALEEAVTTVNQQKIIIETLNEAIQEQKTTINENRDIIEQNKNTIKFLNETIQNMTNLTETNQVQTDSTGKSAN